MVCKPFLLPINKSLKIKSYFYSLIPSFRRNFEKSMSDGPISIRLGKAATEFNVGVSTIVDFLHRKGFKIDSNPNTKLSPEMHTLLVKEYQPDKAAKDIAKHIELEYQAQKAAKAEERKPLVKESDDFKGTAETLVKPSIQDKPVTPKQEEPKPAVVQAPVAEKAAEPKVVPVAPEIAPVAKTVQPEPAKTEIKPQGDQEAVPKPVKTHKPVSEPKT
jgi:translation initiation factor IF-2